MVGNLGPWFCAAVLLWVLAFPEASRAQLVLNEVFYDPPGSDGGHEFVELYLAGNQSLSFDGIRLVFVNGASPDVPKTVWRAAEGIVLSPGRFWVVGEEEVEPKDSQTSLGLQNGPDALWLMRGEEVLDRLAWGEMEGLGEGLPADDVSGTSLGRVPDGEDHDDNASDWRALPHPNPGEANVPDLLLRPCSLQAAPPFSPTPATIRLEASIVAEGYAPVQEGLLRWRLDAETVGEEWLKVGASDSVSVSLLVWMGSGRHLVQVQVGEDASVVAGDSLVYQVEPGAVVLNEVMARPLPERPEWIELHAIASAPPVLRAWAICDAGRNWRELPDIVIPPGGFALITSDPDKLRFAFEIPSGIEVVSPVGGWPTLNNTQATGAEFVDEVLLRDELGAVVDRLAYTGDLIPEPGRSIERGLVAAGSPLSWFASPEGSSPGRENVSAEVAPPAEGLLLQPNPFTPDGDGDDEILHVVFRHELDDLAVTAEVFDLEGGRVRSLGADSAGGGLRQWLWDGRDENGRAVPMGAYVVVVRGGSRVAGERRWSGLVALGRRR